LSHHTLLRGLIKQRCTAAGATSRIHGSLGVTITIALRCIRRGTSIRDATGRVAEEAEA